MSRAFVLRFPAPRQFSASDWKKTDQRDEGLELILQPGIWLEVWPQEEGWHWGAYSASDGEAVQFTDPRRVPVGGGPFASQAQAQAAAIADTRGLAR